MTFDTSANPTYEIHLGRIRKRALGLWLPLLALLLSAGIVSYFANKRFEVWQLNIAYSVALAIAILFWFIPVIRHLSFYIDIGTSNIYIRQGLFGGKSVELTWREISGIEQRGGSITVTSLKLNGPLVMTSLPKAKWLATLIRNAASTGSASLPQ